MARSSEQTRASDLDAKNAIDLLKADHKKVADLFEKYEEDKETMGPEEKGGIAKQICDALTVHATVEEEIFYPACSEEVEDTEDLLAEAEVEHQTLKDLIAQIEQEEPETAQYDAKVKVLGEYVKHHVKEEEGELFPKAQSSELDLDELGAEIAARKEELMGDIEERQPAQIEA